jgi:hypothetical protein
LIGTQAVATGKTFSRYGSSQSAVVAVFKLAIGKSSYCTGSDQPPPRLCFQRMVHVLQIQGRRRQREKANLEFCAFTNKRYRRTIALVALLMTLVSG